jgi:uncharacterized membrane protein
VHFETSLAVSVPRDKAYAAFTDFESMPKWSKQVTTIRVLRRDGDLVYLEAESTSAAGLRTGRRTMRLFPPNKVESEGETRLTQAKRTVLFEEVASGTKVTATLDVRVKGFWRLFLTTPGSQTAEESVVEELASFGKYVEGLP